MEQDAKRRRDKLDTIWLEGKRRVGGVDHTALRAYSISALQRYAMAYLYLLYLRFSGVILVLTMILVSVQPLLLLQIL